MTDRLTRFWELFDQSHISEVMETYVLDPEIIAANQEIFRKFWYALQRVHPDVEETQEYVKARLGSLSPLRPLGMKISDRDRERLSQGNLKIFANHQSLLDIPYIIQMFLEQGWSADELFFAMRSDLPGLLTKRGWIPMKREKEGKFSWKRALMYPVLNHQDPLRAKQLQYFVPEFFNGDNHKRSLVVFPQWTRKKWSSMQDFSAADKRRMNRSVLGICPEKDIALLDIDYQVEQVHIWVDVMSPEQYKKKFQS